MNRKQCEVGDRVQIMASGHESEGCYGTVQEMTDDNVRILVQYAGEFPDDVFVLRYEDLERCFEPGEHIIVDKPGSVLDGLTGHVKKDGNGFVEVDLRSFVKRDDGTFVEVNIQRSYYIEKEYVNKYHVKKKRVYTNEDFNVGDEVMVKKADSNFNGMIGKIVEKYGNMASVWIFGFDQLVFYYSDLSLLSEEKGEKSEEAGRSESTGGENEETGERTTVSLWKSQKVSVF